MGFFDFLGNIGAIFSDIASALSSLFVYLFNALAAALTFVWNTLVALAGLLGNILASAGKVLFRLWTEHLKPFFTTVVNIFEGMFDSIRQLARDIQKIIQRVKDFYNTWIGPALSDFLDFISRLRAALVVFRILGFNWAKKLDADLAGIQAAVTKVIQDIVGTLNDVISLLQVMVDPLLIIRKDFFTHTLFSSLSALKRATAYGNSRPLRPDEQAHVTSYHDAIYGPDGPAHVAPDGSVVLAPAMSEVSAKLDAQAGVLGLPIL